MNVNIVSSLGEEFDWEMMLSVEGLLLIYEVCVCVCARMRSVVPNSFATPWTRAY